MPAIDPARSVLLVMDYQPAMIRAFPDTDTLLTPVEAAVDFAIGTGRAQPPAG